MFIITNILVLFQFLISYCIFEIVALNFLLKKKKRKQIKYKFIYIKNYSRYTFLLLITFIINY